MDTSQIHFPLNHDRNSLELEIFLLNEVSQKEKDKCHDITYMWYLKYGSNYCIYKTEDTIICNNEDHEHGEQTCGCQEGGGESGMDREFGVGRCKLLHLEWVSNGVPTV